MALAYQVVTLMHNLLRSEQGITRGLANQIDQLEQLPRILPEQIVQTQVPANLAAQEVLAQYPRFQVYCERIDNEMKEKFNRFSGVVHLVVDILYSHARTETMAQSLQTFVEAVTDTVEANRGVLAPGVFLPGKYRVSFEQPKAGGRGVIQSAKVAIPLEVTRP